MTGLDATWLDEHPDWDVYAHPLDAMLLQVGFLVAGRPDLAGRIVSFRWLREGQAFAFDRTAVNDEALRECIERDVRERAAENLRRDVREYLATTYRPPRPRLGVITGL